MPGLSGSIGVYVIPWSLLPEIISLSVHDRMLHEALGALKQVTPVRIRGVVLDVARTGIGGIEMARAARGALDREHKAQEISQFTLMADALKQLGEKEAQPLSGAELATVEGQKTARQILMQFAVTIGASDQDIIDRLEEWSRLAAPAGRKDAGGRLRRLYDDLTTWGRHLDEWAEPEPPESQFMARRVVQGLEVALKLAGSHLDQIARRESMLRQVMSDWKTERARIARHIERLSWILDGWESLRELWKTARDAERYRQCEAVEEVASHVPMMPENELDAEEREMFEALRLNQNDWAKALHGSKDRKIDQELLQRLEKYQQEIA